MQGMRRDGAARLPDGPSRHARLPAAGFGRRPLAYPAHDVQITAWQTARPARAEGSKVRPSRTEVLSRMISGPNRHATTVTDDQVGRIARPPGEGRPVFLPVRGTARRSAQTRVLTKRSCRHLSVQPLRKRTLQRAPQRPGRIDTKRRSRGGQYASGLMPPPWAR